MSDKFDAFNRWAESTEANFLDSDNESPWNIAQKTWQACAAHLCAEADGERGGRESRRRNSFRYSSGPLSNPSIIG